MKNIAVIILSVLMVGLVGLTTLQCTNRKSPPTADETNGQTAVSPGQPDGLTSLDVILESKVNAYAGPKSDDPTISEANLRGTVIEITDGKILTIERQGDSISINVAGANISVATAWISKEDRLMAMRQGKFEEIKVDDFVSLDIEFKPSEPDSFKVLALRLYKGDLKPDS
jgi:hypothetical protein